MIVIPQTIASASVTSGGPRPRKPGKATGRSRRAGENGGAPSLTRAGRGTPPPAARSEAAPSVPRHGRSVRPRIRWGTAEPTVRAPIRIPIARPRPSRNHVAMIFIAGGYAPAMLTPVTKRRTRAGARLDTQRASAPFAAAPRRTDQVMSVRGDQTSGRLPSALASVPTMKPAWTAIVSAALPLSSSAHSRSSAGRTAEALNQRARAPSSASERTVSCRQARVTPGALLDDARVPEPPDVRRGEPEVLQHVLGVLGGQGRGAPNRPGRVGKLDRDADLADAPVLGVLDVHDHPPVVDLRVPHHLLDVVHLADAHVGLREEGEPLVAVARLDDRLDLAPRARLLGVAGAHELVGFARGRRARGRCRARRACPRPRSRRRG